MELDPRLWKELPQHILEVVIGKLPFSRAVAFRSVSKLWKSDVIPSIALGEASRQTALLSFDFHQTGIKGSARWLRLCNSKYHSGKTNLFQDFQPSRSFPSPEPGQVVQLVHSEGGLLFFAFIKRDIAMVSEIIVSNPLTAQSRSLGLPRPLQCKFDKDNICNLLVGVVMNAKTGKYLLVAAGRDGIAKYRTFLYRSSISTWSNGPSLYPALRDTSRVDSFVANRSVCYDGNLYWKARISYFQNFGYNKMQQVIKFDVQHETWRIAVLPEDLQYGCILRSWQMASLEGKICLWHLHDGYGRTDHNENHCAPIEVEVLFDQNYARFPLRRGLNPGFKSTQPRVDGIEKLLGMHAKCGEWCERYFAFSEQHVLYHVMLLYSWDKKVYLKVIPHDKIQDSYSKLEGMVFLKEKYLDGGDEFSTQVSEDLSPSSVWGFAASLTSLP